MKQGCIEHRAKSRLVILHADYLEICDNDSAAAILLKILEYWTNNKIDAQEQGAEDNIRRKQAGLEPREYELWIYKSGKQFLEDALGLLKEHDVVRGLEILLNKGYIQRRHNPKFHWDRTWQYLLNISTVQNALTIPHQYGMHSHQQGMDNPPVDNRNGTGKEAIPEITIETPSEITTDTMGAPAPAPSPTNGNSLIKRQGAFEALASFEKNNRKGGDDFSRFPEEVRDVIREFCRLWQVPLPRFSKSAGGTFAQWINGGRDLAAACGGYGPEALKKAYEKYNKIPPDRRFLVGWPGSVIKLAGDAAGELARSKPAKKPIPTRAEFSEWVQGWNDPDIEDTDQMYRLWLQQQGVQTA